MSGRIHAPVALTLGNNSQYTLYRRLDGPQSRSTHYGEEKYLVSDGNRIPVAQLVARHNTDWAVPASIRAYPTYVKGFFSIGNLRTHRVI
jgi:hypothetical protein